MKNFEIDKYLIKDSKTIFQAIEKINEFSTGQALVLFVIDEHDKILGSITDGDIRRSFLKGIKITDNVSMAMNKEFYFIEENDCENVKKIKKLRLENIRILPIINNHRKIINIVNFSEIKTQLPIDAIIMAGGRGTRLHPYTKDLPKPMLELNKKPIIAHNIDRLIYFGVKNFYVSVNHLKEQIINFLNDYYRNKNIKINFLEEDKPLGTIGSVALQKKYLHDDLLVLNADILTNIDFEDFFLSYQKNHSDMAVGAFNVKIDIPYAVMETKGEIIKSFIEKPSYIYHSNAGIYLFKQKFIKKIPSNQPFDSIDLIDDLIKNENIVSHFPIRGYWLDIGNLQNYRKAQEDIEHIKFD